MHMAKGEMGAGEKKQSAVELSAMEQTFTNLELGPSELAGLDQKISTESFRFDQVNRADLGGRVAKLKAYAEIGSAFISGLEGKTIRVEAGLLPGLPYFDVVGLPDRSIKESLKRIRAALLSLGQGMPKGQVTINLAPAALAKSGSAFDLPIALSVLALHTAASSEIVAGALETDRIRSECGWSGKKKQALAAVGELGLNGDILPIRGIFGMVASLLDRGYEQILVPQRQLDLLRFFGDKHLIGVDHLKEAAGYCGIPVRQAHHGKHRSRSVKKPLPINQNTEKSRSFEGKDHPLIRLPGTVKPISGLFKIASQETTVRGIACALAGGHHALLVGSPGSGKSIMAGLCAALLPPPGPATALRILSTYSVVYSLEELPAGYPARPVRAPHHTITAAGLRGSRLFPGEISLADGGVLFFDELAEVAPATLSILRQPLEDGFIRLTYNNTLHIYPAKFIFIGATNPCPCGLRYERGGRCHCTERQKRRYLEKLFGPFGDRISLFIETGSSIKPSEDKKQVSPATADFVETPDLSAVPEERRSETEIVDLDFWMGRILEARATQVSRNGYRKGEERLNVDLDPALDQKHFQLSGRAASLLDRYTDEYRLSVRSRHNLLKVGRTFADLDGSADLLPEHLMEAAFYRRLS